MRRRGQTKKRRRGERRERRMGMGKPCREGGNNKEEGDAEKGRNEEGRHDNEGKTTTRAELVGSAPVISFYF
jgi:hypothetical protein